MGVAVAAALVMPLAMVPAAYAAEGDTPLNITFDGLVSTTATLTDVGATTEFTRTTLFDQATDANRPAGSMWDPGTYVIGSNPNDFHAYWADYEAGDNMLIVNGFTEADQKVLEVSAPGVTCNTPGSTVGYTFSANMTNILPLSAASDGGAAITVYINGVALGSEVVLSNNPDNIIGITGSAPASNPMVVTIVNNGTAYSGNDFAIDDIKLTQVGECEPPCEPTTVGVWHNYTGNFAKTGVDVNHDGIPDLNDPNWHVLPAQPNGQHAVATRGFNAPYQTGKPGNGDWFYWSNEGHTCVQLVPVPTV